MKVKNKKLVILCLIFSLLIPISIILNFIKIVPNDMNEKRNTLPKLSNQNINITTPENKTYTEPMSGYYPATYGFENDIEGSWPSGWTIDATSTLRGTAQVLYTLDGHNKVVELHDNNAGGGRDVRATKTFDTPALFGDIEFWLRTDEATKDSTVEVRNSTNGIAFGFHITSDNWSSPYGTTIQKAAGGFMDPPSDNTWYHVRIAFETTTSIYEGLGQWEYKIWINGEESVPLYFDYTLTTIDQLRIRTRGTQANYYTYFDAVGYSWNPNYNIRDNIYEGLLLSFDNSTNLDWIGYSLDGGTNRTIMGNTTFPMPENGLHTIQVFGNDTFGTEFQSDIRYFTVHIPCNISINTPENKTYTEPMSGYYPATYGFENDEDGSKPHNWFVSEVGGIIQIIEKKDSHNKVAEIHETSDSLNELENRFSTPQTTGILEYYFMVNRIDDYHDVGTIGNGSSYEAKLQIIVGNDGYLKYLNYLQQWIIITSIEANWWYHMRIEFDCSDDWHLWLDGISQDGGSGYTYVGTPNSFDRLKFRSSNAGSWKDAYIWTDAIGYSWDPNYNIGDNLNEGLLLSFDNSTNLDWIGYSLDDQTNKTILGNTTFPMPENGLHTIQVFGNDTFGTDYRSDIRDFTTDYFKDIEIITPENKTYTEPMRGYYPATYGFENDEIGKMASGWLNFTPGYPGTYTEVISEFNGHKNVLMGQWNSIDGWNLYNIFDESEGTIEFWVSPGSNSGIPSFFFWLKNSSNDNILELRFQQDNISIKQGGEWYNIGTYIYDTWYHIRIDFRSNIGNPYEGLNQNEFKLYIDGIDKGNYALSNPGNPQQIHIMGTHAYFDAFGYSWDPNYNIGENLNEGLLLSYNISGSLDWMGYSLDGQANKTIIGNTTIPMPGNGVRNIQVFGNDSLGSSYHSNKIYFSIDLSIADTISPVITILSPSSDALFGNPPPNFSISIVESNLHLIWYTMDGGITKFFITELNGTINQDMWNSRPNGLNTVRFSANDTMANLGYSENNIEKDTAEPIITINSPNEGEIFTITPPTFSLSINESHLDSIWYTFDDGQNSIFCSSTGQIDGQLWLVLGPGEYTLRFYANDTLSNVGFTEVTIVKGQVVTFVQHYSPFFIFLIIAVGLVGLIWFINKKFE